MRVLTCLVFALTIIAGWLSYNSNGSVAEVVKLAYAYLALMSVVCAMIVLTMKPAVPSRVSLQKAEVPSNQVSD